MRYWFSLYCCLLSLSVFAGTAPRRVTYADLGAVLGSAAVSPDGKMIAAEDGERLVILAKADGRLIGDLGSGILPLWSPLKTTLSFISLRTGMPQLWIWQPGSGIRQLTFLPEGLNPDFTTRFLGSIHDVLSEVYGVVWSPDGLRIAFSSREDDVAQKDQSGPLVLDNNTHPDLVYKGICKIPAGVCGSTLKIFGRDLRTVISEPDRPAINQIFVADIEAMTVRQVTSGEELVYGPAWLNEKGLFAFSVPLRGGVTDLAGVYMKSTAVNTKLVRIPLDGSAQTIVAQNLGAARHLKATGSSGQFAMDIGPDYLSSTHKAVLDVSTGELRKVDEMDSAPSVPDATRDTDTVVVYEDGAVCIRSAHSHQSKDIFRFRPKKNLLYGKIETVNWKNSRGDDLTGSVLLPPDFTPGKRYPLIVDAYPLQKNGQGQWMDPMGANQTWAAAGYVAFHPGPRGPHVWMNSADKAFGAAGQGLAGWDVALDDVLSGVDALSARGMIDPDRMCLYGLSNGGAEVSYLVTQTHRFKCAVIASPGMTDWVSGLLRIGGRTSNKNTSGGIDPDTDMNQFVAMSAVFNLHKSKTPMLIAAGDNDGGFLMSAINIYNGVRNAGIPVTFVRYPDQGHEFTGEAMKDFWKRQMAFFNQYLGS